MGAMEFSWGLLLLVLYGETLCCMDCAPWDRQQVVSEFNATVMPVLRKYGGVLPVLSSLELVLGTAESADDVRVVDWYRLVFMSQLSEIDCLRYIASDYPSKEYRRNLLGRKPTAFRVMDPFEMAWSVGRADDALLFLQAGYGFNQMQRKPSRVVTAPNKQVCDMVGRLADARKKAGLIFYLKKQIPKELIYRLMEYVSDRYIFNGACSLQSREIRK